MFRLLLQCWLFSFASLYFFFATSLPVKFLLQYNSVLKRLDQTPLLINFFFKNLGKKRRYSATNRAMSLSTYWLEYGRHVGQLRRRRRAYAPTSNTTSHDNHEEINSWVSFSFP